MTLYTLQLFYQTDQQTDKLMAQAKLFQTWPKLCFVVKERFTILLLSFKKLFNPTEYNYRFLADKLY